MTDAARFSDELRRLRAERGLSYRALAELAHHGKSYIEDLEKGRKPPNEAAPEVGSSPRSGRPPWTARWTL
ncbi:helix-turn-helix domain-containing protein, partial [Actinoplanes bogorensis]